MKKILFFVSLLVLAFSPLARGDENFAMWCKDKMSQLRNSKERALMFYVNNDIAGSISVLKDGLERASTDSDRFQTMPLTLKSILRGVAISNEVEVATSNDKNHLRAFNYYLNKYYEFIFDVANNLDIPFFENTRCGYCRSTGEKYERLFTRYAFEQVKMVLDSFAVNHGGAVYPKGSLNTFTTSLKHSSANAANDLRESIFSTFYACKIVALEDLESDLVTSRYPNQVIAFRSFYAQAQSIVNNSWRCPTSAPNRDYDDNYTTTQSILSRSIILEPGTTRSISIRSPRYVKKLIVTAEGVRNDAKFEVMVNGDVKGTIYVPGRDPSYIVTVEDYTSSIELISQFGRARINQIMVVSE